MALNLGVTQEVFRKLTPKQKRIIQNNSNKDMVLLHKYSNPRSHARVLRWKKYKTITMKTGHKVIIKINKK